MIILAWLAVLWLSGLMVNRAWRGHTFLDKGSVREARRPLLAAMAALVAGLALIALAIWFGRAALATSFWWLVGLLGLAEIMTGLMLHQARRRIRLGV